MPTPSPHLSDRASVPVPPAAEILAELGETFCPSLSHVIERLIDRRAAEIEKGALP